MALFGGRQWNTPGIAGPTDPSQMAIPGMPPQMPQLDMPAPQMPAYQPMGAPPVVPQPRPGFSDPGGMGGKLGQLSDLLLGNNFFTSRQDEQRRAQQAMELAQMKAQSPGEAPSIIRTLMSAGIDPKSPEGRRIITDNLNRPFVVGSPEGGFTPIGGSFGGGPPAVDATMPAVSDQASYDAIPSGAQFRDPQGNVRVKP